MPFAALPADNLPSERKNGRPGTEGREPLRSIQNNAIASMACNGHFRQNRVVSRELFAGVTWCVVVSSDGIRAEVARLGNGAAP